MHCPKCGTYTDQPPKYCKSCGLKLADHASLLERSDGAPAQSEDQIRREKRLMTGVSLMCVTLFNLTIFFCVFGITALQDLASDSRRSLLWMFVSFIATSLITGGLGLFNLLRSGFLKNLQERQLRLELALIEKRRQALEATSERAAPETQSPPGASEATSIADETTRRLRSASVVTNKIQGP
ncbi:MAG TPA: zinc ribbon domain-containing protein [Blastocatellia bacterium]|nr:zinc ribbon domain-containing protein [Blastocatellia bacterium]